MREGKNFLADVLLEDPSYRDLIQAFEDNKSPVYLYGIIKEASGYILYALKEHLARPIILVTETEYRAREVYRSLRGIMEDQVLIFPDGDSNFYKISALESENEILRLKALARLSKGDRVIVIASFQALKKRLTKKKYYDYLSILIDYDSEIDTKDLSDMLSLMKYKKKQTVEGPGDFAIRGGIIDVFPPSEEMPFRIELFDTEVDSIRTFDIQSQRSVMNRDRVEIGPAKELIIDGETLKKLAGSIEKDLKKMEDHPTYGMDINKCQDKFQSLIGQLRDGLDPDNPNLISPYLGKNDYSDFFDYLSEEGLVCFEDLTRIYDHSKEDEKNFLETFSSNLMAGEVLNGHEKLHLSWASLLNHVKKFSLINMTPLLKRSSILNYEEEIEIKNLEAENFNRDYKLFYRRVGELEEEGERVIILSEDETRTNRISADLRENGVNVLRSEGLDVDFSEFKVIIAPLSYGRGMEFPRASLHIFTLSEIYGKSQTRKRKKRRKKSKKASLTINDLEVGDYVVHEKHGIARYDGIKQVEVDGTYKDYLLLSYRGNDKLYIPTDQMNMVQKYIGSEGKSPSLSKLGGTDWIKAKQRAKKSVDEIAEDLVDLYAQRAKEVGFAFSKDSPWQMEFEDAFIYEETEGQLIATKEIKEDMESTKPMDRLLMGDVGFGKTEVAMRAAFKAVMDGKQVAFLVPTTVLCQQHYNSFRERFKDFPVTIDMLSRFRTKKETDRIEKDLKNGRVDIIVGTHKLLSKKIEYKDLGLLIIDEEQRFGVRDKEKIKKIRENIDVLTLTATPIPRTLQMSLTGIRDMSILDEPPEERMPVQTYVMEFDGQIARDAILRELSRGGQVYFIYNRVQDIDDMAGKLRELVPEASIIVAHGQMTPSKLEDAMIAFNEGQYDILLSTTIIESGMDIQNVNTLLVYNADRMGLAQLYQLKGRIGRGDRTSYAYFTYQKDKNLSENSEKRLMAIRDFTEFGSGFKIAMRDLELRGAGNLLGESQSGHIESIGYDMYVRMLEEAVAQAKGRVQGSSAKNPRIEEREVDTDLKVDAYIPEDYIPEQNQKIDMYSRIASIYDGADYDEIIEELIDRYGDIPKSVLNVLKLSLIKALARDTGIFQIREVRGEIIYSYDRQDRYSAEIFQGLMLKFKGGLKFDVSSNPSFSLEIKGDKLDEIIDFLSTLKNLIERRGKNEKE